MPRGGGGEALAAATRGPRLADCEVQGSVFCRGRAVTRLYYDERCRTDPVLRAQLARFLLEQRGRPHRRVDVKGHVVEFRRGGQHRCGVVRAASPRSVLVLDQDGREERLPPDKLLDVCEETIDLRRPRSQIVGALRRIDRRREDARRSLDARALWELIEEARQREWTLAELTAVYFVDDPGIDGRAALARSLDDGHLFCRHGRRFAPLPPDVVSQRERAAAQAARADRWTRAAATWLRSVADGTPGPPPDRAEHAVDLLRQRVLLGPKCPHAHEAIALKKAAHLHGPAAAFDVLVKLGHWDEDENLDLLRYEVPTTFAADALAEAERGDGWPAGLRARRQWFGRAYGFPSDEGRCERAISVRRGLLGHTVGVHFASPALFLPPGGRVQSEAAERGAAIRLPDRLVPMLPLPSLRRASLARDERRPALTVEVRFGRRFEVRSYALRLKSIRLSDLVSRAGSAGRGAEDRRVRKLLGLARQLRQRRREAGAVVIPEPEVDVVVRDRAVELRRVEADAPERVLWSELAILANTLAGEFCATHGIPAIYRVESPVGTVLVGEQHDPVACHRQKRLMPKATLQVAPSPHHGLGAAQYAPISRPCHRYTDLLMHQQLVHFLAHGTPRYSSDDLEEALLRTAHARGVAAQTEAGARRYWLLKHLEGRFGQDVDAVVLERSPGGHLVQLADCLLKVFEPVRGREHFPPGRPVQVRLSHVSARRDVIRVAGLRAR